MMSDISSNSDGEYSETLEYNESKLETTSRNVKNVRFAENQQVKHIQNEPKNTTNANKRESFESKSEIVTTNIVPPMIPEKPEGLLEKHLLMTTELKMDTFSTNSCMKSTLPHSIKNFHSLGNQSIKNIPSIERSRTFANDNTEILSNSQNAINNDGQNRTSLSILERYIEENKGNTDLKVANVNFSDDEVESKFDLAEGESAYIGPIKTIRGKNLNQASHNNKNCIQSVIRKSNRITLKKSSKIFEKRRKINMLINQEYQEITEFTSKHSLVRQEVGSRKSRFRDPEYNFYNHNKIMLNDSTGQKMSFFVAALIKDFRNKKNIIATQTPLKSSIEDFWKMILTKHVHYIFSFVDYDQNNKSITKFWPRDEKPRQYRNMTVTTVDRFDGKSLLKRELKISTTGGTKNVTLVIYQKWAPHKQPEDFNIIGMLVEDMKFLIEDHPNQKVVVMCETGQNQTAVFISAYLGMQEIELSAGFDMVKIAKYMKEQLPRANNKLVHYRILNTFMMKACENIINNAN